MLAAMSDQRIEALKQVPLFAHAAHKELEFVASRTDEVDVGADKPLLTQGRPADSFYVILEGECDVTIDGKHRRTLRPGDFFGEIGMLDRGPATATVTTKTPAKLMVMSHAQFRDAIKGNDDLLLPVLKSVAERLRADAHARISTA